MLERSHELSLTEAVKLVSTKYWGDCCWESFWQCRFNLQQGEPTDLWSSEASLAQFQSSCGNLISFPACFPFSQPISHRNSEHAGSFARLHVQPWMNPYPIVSTSHVEISATRFLHASLPASGDAEIVGPRSRSGLN